MTLCDVGVVVVTRDRCDRVLATLDRLAGLPERPELIVVDNGSGDGTPRAVRRRHPRATVLSLSENAGSSARNAGARALSTELVAFSDDDSWWAPGSLSKAGETFALRPSLGLLQARILVGPKRRPDPICAEMSRSPLPVPAGLPGPAILGFIACGAVVRRRAFLGVGGFHSRFGVGGEETLLAFDMAAAGWELAYVDSVVAHHHPDAGGVRPGRPALEVRNELWTSWLRRRLPAAGAASLRVAAETIRRRDPRGLVQAVRGLPWVLRERQPLPPGLDRAAGRIY